MAKISETQRRYFIERVRNQINDKIQTIKHKNSAKIAKAAKNSYDSYLKEVGVDKNLKRLKALHDEIDDLKQLMGDTVKNINRYKTCFSYSDFDDFFKEEARKIANDQFSKTKEGKEIKRLEKLQDQSTDYLYGLNTDNEITQGLNKILNPSGIKLIEA